MKVASPFKAGDAFVSNLPLAITICDFRFSPLVLEKLFLVVHTQFFGGLVDEIADARLGVPFCRESCQAAKGAAADTK